MSYRRSPCHFLLPRLFIVIIVFIIVYFSHFIAIVDCVFWYMDRRKTLNSMQSPNSTYAVFLEIGNTVSSAFGLIWKSLEPGIFWCITQLTWLNITPANQKKYDYYFDELFCLFQRVLSPVHSSVTETGHPYILIKFVESREPLQKKEFLLRRCQSVFGFWVYFSGMLTVGCLQSVCRNIIADNWPEPKFTVFGLGNG